MSIASGVAIFAGLLIFLALVAAMFQGRNRKRLGPVNANQAPGNPPVPGQGPVLVADPWPWIKGGGLLIFVIVASVLLFIYSTVILTALTGVWAGLPALTWVTMVTIALVLLALAYTFKNLVFPDVLVRALKGAAVVFLWLALMAPLLTWILPCSSTDIACKYQQSVKAETQRQRQAAAQRAIEASQQPVAPRCNVQRMPHRYPASKPAVKDNPGGECAVALFIAGHCVYFTQNYKEEPSGTICVNMSNEVAVRDMRNNIIDMPEDVDRVWSTADAFDGSIGLWQPRYTKLFSWR